MPSVETGQMSAVETGHMSAAETGQIPATETRQMSAAETGEMSAVGAGSRALALDFGPTFSPSLTSPVAARKFAAGAVFMKMTTHGFEKPFDKPVGRRLEKFGARSSTGGQGSTSYGKFWRAATSKMDSGMDKNPAVSKLSCSGSPSIDETVRRIQCVD